MFKAIYKFARSYYRKKEFETSFILRLIRVSLQKLYATKLAISRAGYTNKTIAVYFRKLGAQVGEHCDINIHSLGDEPYLVSIGNRVFISGGVTFHTHDGGGWVFQDRIPGIRVHGTITIEDNCMIGRNVHLLPNIHIGRNSIVGAGSVVISDVPPNSVVMGVPARVFSSMSKYEETSIARWKEQKPPGLQIGEVNESSSEWWTSSENLQEFRKHLTNLFMNHDEAEEEAGN